LCIESPTDDEASAITNRNRLIIFTWYFFLSFFSFSPFFI
jgi:hypothetical protein